MAIIERDFELNEDENFDITIKNGDFSIFFNSNQEIVHTILVSNIGEFKMKPDLGIGIDKMLNGKSTIAQKRAIRKGLEKDGFDVQDLQINLTNENFNINTNAIRKK